MTYCRNFCPILLIFLFGILPMGCGGEVPTEPDEEVVSDKWIELDDKWNHHGDHQSRITPADGRFDRM